MTKFKVGDKVKVINSKNNDGTCYSDGVPFIGKIVEVVSVDSFNTYPYGLGGVAGIENTTWQKKDLVLVSHKTIMNKLTSKIRRLFNPDLQKQYKAGLIDECGDLTDSGKAELELILREANKEELIKVAEEIIAEAEKEKCC